MVGTLSIFSPLSTPNQFPKVTALPVPLPLQKAEMALTRASGGRRGRWGRFSLGHAPQGKIWANIPVLLKSQGRPHGSTWVPI